jgi:hypothetical protein
MLSSLNGGFSPCVMPTLRRANPDEETTDWRAVCGRTACTVRRAGRALALPDPYHLQLIGKKLRLKKPVISSIPVLRAELHVSAMYRRNFKPKIFTDITTPVKQSYSPYTGKISEI